MDRPHFERHVVLVNPEIHWNTGNIGRSCLGTGARLHLIKPLGFSLEDKKVKRAGLDYWPRVDLHVWESFDDLCTGMAIASDEVALFAKTGKTPFRNLPERDRLFLIFGAETRGLPDTIRRRFDPLQTYYIPIRNTIRSLNLSSAVAVALYESLRHAESDLHEWPSP